MNYFSYLCSMNGHRHHHRSLPRRIWDGIAQPFLWMWHDIRPAGHFHRHKHSRSFGRRMLDRITEPFHQMAKDLGLSASSYRRKHKRSFPKRMWDWFAQQMHYMKADFSKKTAGPTLGEEMQIGFWYTITNIRHDLKFKLNRETLAEILYLMLSFLIIVRIIAVWKTCNISGLDPFYTYRHIIFTIVWTILFLFFFNLFLLKKTVSPLIQNLREMERASFMAFLACILKFITSSVYVFMNRIAVVAINWATAYYICELLIWFMLSVFLYYYWRNRRQVRIKAQMGKFEA